jgi:hypothetical protein
VGINALATKFERRFLFSIGRHFWNFVAICGFTGLATGGVFALNGALELAQKEGPLKRQLKTVPNVAEVSNTFEGWFSSKCPSMAAKEGYSETKHYRLCDNFTWMTTQAQPGWDRACSSKDYEGKTYKRYDYVDGKCSGFEWMFADVWVYANQYRADYAKAYNEYNQKLAAKQQVESQNSQIEAELVGLRTTSGIQIGLGGVIAGWGLGVVALSALNAALLAIERNSRDEQSHIS